ncbi:archease [Candidatus Woesearchaeota archaeon]|nr:archease [Candidatus Woesearchaeota archaeon]
MTHKFIEDFATADIAFEASGEDLDELFKSSAEALFEILANPKKVNKSIVKKISLSNKNIENLLYDFLSEILYIKDNDFMIFNSCNVKITELDEIYQLKVTLHGEKINPKKHELHSDAKAITLHQFSIEKTKNGYNSFVIVDI